MIAIIISFVPPFLWSVVNHIDKYLLSRAHHKSSVEVLMVYSTGFSLVAIPILYFLIPNREDLFTFDTQLLIQVISGVLLTFSIFFYLKALFKDEASIVVPLFLLVPVFGYFLSYFILGESLTMGQTIFCCLVVLGSLILSLEFKEEGKLRLNHGVLFFMVLSTLFQAIEEIIFKFSTVESSFLESFFWLQIGIAIFGIFLLILRRHAFKHFVESVKVNGFFIFVVNIISEFISSFAYMVKNYAILLAPIVIVMTLNGFQPVFVFLIGTILSIFFPKLSQEKVKAIHLVHKGLAIGIMVVGTILTAQTL